MKRIFFVTIFFLINNFLFGQLVSKSFYDVEFFRDTLFTHNDEGNVVITEDAKLEQTITNFSRAYKRQPEKIWRVQIYFGSGITGRVAAQTIKSNFEAKHPGVPAYLVFEEPYFKVRVGAFSKRIDAERLKAQLLEDYDKLFIIEDDDDE